MRRDEIRAVPRQVTSSRVTTHRDASRHVAIRHDASRRITFATFHEASPHVATRHDASRRITGRDRASPVGVFQETHGSPMRDRTILGQILPFWLLWRAPGSEKWAFQRENGDSGTHEGPSLTGVGAKRASFGWFSRSPGRNRAILGQFLPFWLLQEGSIVENVCFMVGKRRF